MDYAELCERFVATNFPAAAIAVVGGSTARGTRTATSDIDLLLVGDGLFSGDRDSIAATYRFSGEVIEVFGYTSESFERWAHSGVAQYRPVIAEILVDGMTIRGGHDLDLLRERWREILAQGPLVTPHDLEMRRYVITDLLDDLADSTDPLEQRVIASTLFDRTAELILLANGRWIGTGKYLPRRLRAFSEHLTQQLSDPLLSGDLRAFSNEVQLRLQRAGGRVQTGFVR